MNVLGRPNRNRVARWPAAGPGRFAAASPSTSVRADAPVIRELAGRVQTSRYYFPQDEVPPPSEILLKRSKASWKLGHLWEDMGRNAFLSGLWMKRSKAVLGLPRYVLPRDETPRAKENALFCRQVLRGVPRLHTNLVHQFQGIRDGWAAEEILWQPQTTGPLAGKWAIDLVDRPMWRFVYKMLPTTIDGKPELEPRLHVRRLGGGHVPAPSGKFLVNRVGSKDNPWGGLGLYHFCYWYWWLSEHGIKYFSVLIEKWAQPTAMGKYKRSADQKANDRNVQVLFDAIHQIQTEYSIVIPDELIVELLEAKRGGEVSYKEFLGLCNLAMALVVLGEADTSGFEQGQGSFARRRVSNEVRLETIRIDAHEQDAHLTDDLLRPIVDVNFGVNEPAPLWYTEVDDAEDLKMRQERVDSILAQGLPVVLDDYYRVNKARVPRVGEPIIRKLGQPVVEVVDPPDGFPLRQEVPVELPLSASERAALRAAGREGLHLYRL